MQTTLKLQKTTLVIVVTISLALLFGLAMRPVPLLAAAATPQQNPTARGLHINAPSGGCDNGNHNGEQTIEWNGTVIAAPADGFIGTWTIAFSSDEQRTVIVDCATEIRDFTSELPPVGSWIKVAVSSMALPCTPHGCGPTTANQIR